MAEWGKRFWKEDFVEKTNLIIRSDKFLLGSKCLEQLANREHKLV